MTRPADRTIDICLALIWCVLLIVAIALQLGSRSTYVASATVRKKGPTCPECGGEQIQPSTCYCPRTPLKVVLVNGGE